jgi:GNAT superfamily N-acetyltransferase
MKNNDQKSLEKLYSENIQFDWDSLKFKHTEDEDSNRLDFYNNNGAVGYIEWSKSNGEVDKIYVGEPYRRKGVATYIWQTAEEWANQNGQPEPQHSSRRSKEGDEFARSIGGYIPRLTDDIDGWSSKE